MLSVHKDLQSVKMLTLAKAGKYNGYLLEGMACPGGCVGGAGVLSDAKRAEIKLKQEMANSQLKILLKHIMLII